MAESCQVCGKPASTEAFLEGARVWLCANCLKFGRAVAVRQRPAPTGPVGFGEVNAVEGFGQLIKRAREARKISAGDLARKIFVNEKELVRIERGGLVPSEGVARKLERELGIRLLVSQ